MVRRTSKAEARKDEATGEKTVNQYRLLSEAGRGTFCEVKWAEDTDKRPYAVKVFHRGVLDRQSVSYFDRDGASTISLKARIDEELRLLGELRHRSIVSLEEVIDDPEHEKIYAVLEGLVGGQLMVWDEDFHAYGVGAPAASEIRKHWGDQVRCTGASAGSLSDFITVYQEAIAAHAMVQLLAAVEYMHGQGVIHKDLKPDNIMLTLPTPREDPRFVRLLSLEGWPSLEGPHPVSPDAMEGDLQTLLDRFPLVAKIGDFNSARACTQPDCLIYDAEGTQLFTPPECFMRDGGIRG